MTDTTDAPSRAFSIIREVLATPTTATADTIGDKTAARIEQRLKAAGLLVDAPTEEWIEQAERVSLEVLTEYRKIAAWLEAQAATRGPVGDTMHGLAAEALTNLIEHEYSRHKIPLYGMLDLWMALGITSHPEFDEFYDEHGYAETWSRLLDGVRRLRRAHGLLSEGAPSEEQIEPEALLDAFEDHYLVPRDDPDFDMRSLLSGLEAVARLAAGVTPQEPSAHANPLATSGERVKN